MQQKLEFISKEDVIVKFVTIILKKVSHDVHAVIMQQGKNHEVTNS